MSGAGSDSCTVQLNTAAPSGGTNVTLASSSASVSVPASVNISAGSTSATFTAIAAAVLATQTATLSASEGSSTQTFALTLSASSASLAPSATSISFGDVTVGQTATATVTFTSAETGPVTISNIDVTGSGFSVSGLTVPLTLNLSQTATATVAFEPSQAGSFTGSLTIISNSSAGTLTVPLTGTGSSTATLAKISCTYASVTGTEADACTAALSGAAPAGGLVVGLASNNPSVVVPSSVTVAAGAAVASFTANIAAVSTSQAATLTASAGSVMQTFSLQLNTGTPTLAVSTSTVNFGTITVGKTATQSITLTSTGTGPVTVSGLSVTGSLFFTSGITLPLTLNAGQTASLTLGFNSQNGGPFTGVLTIASNSSTGNLAVNMSAAEVGVLASVTCNSSSMSGAGTDSCSANLNGEAPAGGYAVSLSSNSSLVTVPSIVTVAAGATSVPFNATAAATTSSQTATITASAGGVSNSFSLVLTPTAIGNLAANANKVSFGTVMVGQPATQSLTLTASGGSVQVTSAVVAGTGFSVPGPAFPLTISSGQSVTLSVEFAPSASGSVSGQLTIQSNAANGTIVVPLSATGDVYKVQLNWNAPSNSDPVAGYFVFRAINGGSTFQQLNATPTTATSYLDSTIVDGQNYMYYVVSVDSAGSQSTPSNTTTIDIP